MMRFLLQAAADSSAYKIGYQLGSWLPFAILALILTAMIVSLARRRGKSEK
jgi:hypothetical protein